MKKILVFLACIAMIFSIVACKGECEHTYQNGKCTKCEAVCEHRAYQDGICETCKIVCGHDYEDGVCKICKIECKHAYVGSTCIICTAACKHIEFNEGECTACGYDCVHAAYENGKCTVCSSPCDHPEYDSEGKCVVCKKDCEHNYNEGICDDCGKEDPTFIPKDGGASLYENVVRDFNRIILYKYNYEVLPPRTENEPDYFDVLFEVGAYYLPTLNIGYAFKDINGDGWVELLLMERECRLNALFTIVDKKVVPVEVFQNGMGYMRPDGLIFHNAKKWDSQNRQIHVENHIKYLVGAELVGYEYVKYDEDGDYDTEGELYYVKETGKEKQFITKEEYTTYAEINAELWGWATRHTRISGLKFTPSLPFYDTGINLFTADFSTYDKIIETFTKMYTNVGKLTTYFKKTDWIKGTYDDEMNFTTDEDYYLYNRLISAITRIKAPNSITTYGYALKDFDKDGTNELVLLSSDYVVLAIFTEVNGKAVLLDTFDDWHTAWIDEDGFIHVKNNIFPGFAENREFVIYKVEGGKLVSTLHIGYGYESGKKDAVQNQWYKIENGERTDISKEAFNSFYAEWELDFGTSESYEYTKENAGLTYVDISED